MDPEPPAQDVAAAEATAPTGAAEAVPYATSPDAVAERKRAELSAEMERARNWILAVGIIMYVIEMGSMWAGRSEIATLEVLHGLRYRLSLVEGSALLAFVALWWFARLRPRLCCVIALVLYWAIQVVPVVIAKKPELLFYGIVIKIAFTAAIVRALKSANNVEKLRADLAQVFA